MLAEFLILLVLPALLVAAAVSDLASFTIPNLIQVALLISFAVFAIALGMNPSQLGSHLVAGLIGFVIGFVLFALGYVGGGDAKLFGCIALWFGFGDLLNYAVTASLFGGALTLSLIFLRDWPLPAVLARQPWLARLHDSRSGIPYGVALAAGAFAVLAQSEIFHASILAG